MRKDGQAIKLSNYDRYDNPYTKSEFPGDKIEFRLNGHWLKLDWEETRREASAYLGD